MALTRSWRQVTYHKQSASQTIATRVTFFFSTSLALPRTTLEEPDPWLGPVVTQQNDFILGHAQIAGILDLHRCDLGLIATGITPYANWRERDQARPVVDNSARFIGLSSSRH
jgi:hypothetical protein